MFVYRLRRRDARRRKTKSQRISAGGLCAQGGEIPYKFDNWQLGLSKLRKRCREIKGVKEKLR